MPATPVATASFQDPDRARLRVAERHAGVCANFLTDEAGLDALSGNAVLNGIPVSVARA